MAQDILRVLVKAYSGAKMSVSGYDLPIVLDLAGMRFGNSLVANLDHDYTRRVGNVVARSVQNGALLLSTDINAATASAMEVENSIAKGFKWQASIEAIPTKADRLVEGQSVSINGREVSGPVYVVRKSTLKGFAFVSHGADDSTEVVTSQWQTQ